MERVKVLVVEDVVKILKNQIKLLETYPELEIVGSALSGEAALEEVERCKPDVILCDLGLPQMSGIDVTRAVNRVPAATLSVQAPGALAGEAPLMANTRIL